MSVMLNPSNVLTLDKATYACPYSNIFFKFILAQSNVDPCILWIEIEYANLRGICTALRIGEATLEFLFSQYSQV